MPSVDSNQIVLVLILMDAFIVVVFVVLLWKIKSVNIEDVLQEKMAVFESLLEDADRMSLQIKNSMIEKQQLLKAFDEKFEKRIAHLNELLNKADRAMASPEPAFSEPRRSPPSDASQENKILHMFQQGLALEEIAEQLSIPRGKVKLVLELKKNLK